MAGFVFIGGRPYKREAGGGGVSSGVARGVSRLPGRPNWVKPRGERFGGQSTVPPPSLANKEKN